MGKKVVTLLLAVVFGGVLSLPALAGPTSAERLKHADKNKDGTVDAKERHQEKVWEHKQGSKVNTWWENRADTDNDGKVDSNELSVWRTLEKERIDLNNDGVISAKEKRLCWRHARSRVNTDLEAKYDTNSDGWLEPSEAQELLKDRYTIIKSQGQAKVDSLLEEEYDANNDGLIDSGELEELKQDLGL